MKGINYILGIISIALAISAYAQPYFDWAVGIGGTSLDQGRAITCDSNGNSYIVGIYSGTVDFDPGSGTTNLTSAGSYDVYIQKLSRTGSLIWAKSIGGSGSDFGYDVDLDYAGNILVCGSFAGTADFDPGSGTSNMTSFGSNDGYVLKLDPNGNLVWAKQFGGTASDITWSVAVDNSNNVLLGGEFRGTGDFNPGTGTYYINSVGVQDFYTVKLNSSGNFIWALGAGSTGDDRIHSIGIDRGNNVLITGVFKNTIDFDYGPGTNNLTSAGGWDVFVQKLDSNGIFKWVKKMGGTNNDASLHLNVDDNDNILVGGYYSGSGVFASKFLSSNGGNDMFIVKFHSSGSSAWTVGIGGTSNDMLRQLDTNPDGNVYYTGNFQSTVDFDPGSGVFNLTGLSGEDIFISKLDSNGAFQWAGQISSGLGDESGMAISTNGPDVYCTGYFNSSADFDPTAGVNKLNPSGSFDAFVLKMSECLKSTSTINPTACTSYTSPSGKYTWTASNTYTDTVKNAGGCDSVITVNLTITGPSNGTDVLTACDSLQWIDGKTYYASNSTATHTLTGGAYNGCDSIVTLNLTIVNATTGTDKITACNAYKWIDGKTYTSSNNTATYTIAGGAANGCDSIVTLNLTINTVNATTTAGNDTITANATGATYQWLDCDNNYAVISGATNQMFIATANGHYAVAVTQNGCTDTSACVTVTGVGIDENSLGADVKVYPNPTTGIIHIDPGKVTGTISVKISSIEGKVVSQMVLQNGKVNTIKLNGEAGMYLIELRSNSGLLINSRIIKR